MQGFVWSDYGNELGTALLRADAYYFFDHITNTMRIISRNENAPLTEDEKQRIVIHQQIRSFPFEIVFMD